MRKLTLLLLCCFTLILPVASFAQRGAKAVPEGADLERYPLSNHILTIKEEAELGLRPITLEQPWTGYNWYQGKQRFVLETLPVGTLVLADANGKPIYKADCGNRLVELPTCPKCLAATPVGAQQPKSFLDRLDDAVKVFLRFLKDLLGLLFGLLLLLGLIYLIYQLLRRLFERPEAPPAAPITPITPATPSQPPPAGSNTAKPGDIPTALPQRRFVTCYPGEPTEHTKVVSGGCKEVHVEQSFKGDDWITTIRLR